MPRKSSEDHKNTREYIPMISHEYLTPIKEKLRDLESRYIHEGACVFTDRWRLDELEYGIPSDGPYQTNLPSIEDIISSIQINRDGQVRRIRHEEKIDVLEYQVLTHEIEPTLKPLEEIIRENVFCLAGNRDHVLACLCYILYCVVHSERFNLAYFMTKRMEWVIKKEICHESSCPLIRAKARRESWHERGVIPLLLSSALINYHSSHLNADKERCE
ncbi:hypothetical protein Tco_0969299 [Tanacetum coccineum]